MTVLITITDMYPVISTLGDSLIVNPTICCMNFKYVV